MTKKGNPARFSIGDDDAAKIDANGDLCFWQTVFHIGKIIEVHKK
nr:MAG TPA: hypothetical protein [Crassvirales sp.]